MAEPIKYLSAVAELLKLYQGELLRLLKKYPLELHPDFKRSFATALQKLQQTEANKSIEEAISPSCEPIQALLDQPTARLNKTSIDTRKNLRSQGGNRIFRMTGFKQGHENEEPIEEEAEIRPYRIEDQLMPKMRMKWKAPHYPEGRLDSRDTTTIGHNNIDLLSFTIPEIENSIRRLSLQRSPKSVKQRQLQVYRTLESRSVKKKFIPRLF